MTFRAVLFDWRGTLVVPPFGEQWVAQALRRLGRPAGPRDIGAVLALLDAADDQLDAPGVDTDAAVHRSTYLRVLASRGLDPDLVTALYDVESDVSCNVFADDAAETLRALERAGIRVAIVSDIHVDIRPAFAAAGLADCVDVYTLSFEQGVQKPDAAMFTRTLTALGVAPHEALMVGDRAHPDGAAVDVGMVTLLLPPLLSPAERRLHRVLTLCGVAEGVSHL